MMSGDLTIFEANKPITPEEVKKAVSVFFFCTVVASLVGIYLFRKFGVFSIAVSVVGIGSLLTGCLKRFPVRISINTRLKLLKADYLDAFGREKSMYIDLTKANCSKKPRTRYSNNDSVVGIYQNFFSNFIWIDKVSHFSEEQLERIFTLVKSLK